MTDQFTLILLLETSLEFGRGLLRGVSRYTHLHGPWSLRVHPGHFSQSLPEIGVSARCGMIARITAPEEAEAIRRHECPTIILEPSFDRLASACMDANGVFSKKQMGRVARALLFRSRE